MSIREEYDKAIEIEEARLVGALLEYCDRRIWLRTNETTRSHITDNSLKYACSLIVNKDLTS